jgi:hypothetical protein
MGRHRIAKLFLTVLAVAILGALLLPGLAAADPVAPGWTRYDDTLPDFVYSAGVPTWDTAVNAGSFNGAARQTLGADPSMPSVSFTFRASGVKWIARTGVTRGIGKVTLDGVDQPLVDLYAPAPGFFQVPVFVSGALDPNVIHTMKITMTDTRGLGSNNSITFDAVDLPTGGTLSPAPIVSTSASSAWSLALIAALGLGIVGVGVARSRANG